ncbi:TPA: hypothetical protein ACQVH3_005316, partial [Serratia marcescens]
QGAICRHKNQRDDILKGVVMSGIKFDRRVGHLHRLTGDDFNTTYQSNNSRGEFIFYSIIIIIGILALGIVWQ